MQTKRARKCPNCGKKIEGGLFNYMNNCPSCKCSALGKEFNGTTIVKCKNCGIGIAHGTNYCPSCNTALRPTRLNGKSKTIENDFSIPCHVFTVTETVVVAAPDPDAEVLMVVGIGDILPLKMPVDDSKDFRTVFLSTLDTIGYVGKSTGYVVEFGAKVESPLGYARGLFWLKKGALVYSEGEPYTISCRQPDGSELELESELGRGCPIVEETQDKFKIQLPNGMRGWVDKARVIRVLTTESLPEEEKPEKTDWLGGILAGAAILALGAAAQSAENNRISNAVAQGIRRA